MAGNHCIAGSSLIKWANSKEVVFMSNMAIDAARMMDMLPDEDKPLPMNSSKSWWRRGTPTSPRWRRRRHSASRQRRKAALLQTATLTGIISAPSCDMKMSAANLLESKLDEAENAAALSNIRYTAEEVFLRVRERIKHQHEEKPLWEIRAVFLQMTSMLITSGN